MGGDGEGRGGHRTVHFIPKPKPISVSFLTPFEKELSLHHSSCISKLSTAVELAFGIGKTMESPRRLPALQESCDPTWIVRVMDLHKEGFPAGEMLVVSGQRHSVFHG
jgi:hypothetical protein